MTSHKTRLLLSGAALWAMVLALPALHLSVGIWSETRDWLLFMLPLVFLGTGLRFNHGANLGTLYPLTFTPAIILYPELMGPNVYDLSTYLALIAATVFYVYAVGVYSVEVEHDSAGLLLPGDAAQPQVAQASPHVWELRRTRLIISLLILVIALPLLSIRFDSDIGYRLISTYGENADAGASWIALLIFAGWSAIVISMGQVRSSAISTSPVHIRYELNQFARSHLRKDRIIARIRWSLASGGVAGALLLLLYLSGTGA